MNSPRDYWIEEIEARAREHLEKERQDAARAAWGWLVFLVLLIVVCALWSAR